MLNFKGTKRGELSLKKMQTLIDDQIDTTNAKFPMKVKYITKFETRNKHLFIGINVFYTNQNMIKWLKN